jgi:hypothetical protein
MIVPLRKTVIQGSIRFSISVSLGLITHASIAANSDYRSYEIIEKQLQTIAQKHPERVKLEQIGKSAGGRALYFVQIAGIGKVAANKRPALFVGANIAGFHNAGSEAAMHLIETLAGSNDKKIEEILSTRTIYVAPALNPDAHNALFATPRQLRAGNDSRLDRDLDGLFAEDGADDLDGNGVITVMRKKDANGDMIIDPEDSRRMIKADPSKGQRGNYRVYSEGNDNDKDGLYNEDGIGGIHPDRNFAAGFPVGDAEAGKWPGYAPETKAIMDAVLAHTNIAMAVVYGPANQLLAPPKGFERPTPAGAKPSDEANRLEADDLKAIGSLGDTYKKALEVAGLDNKRSAKQTGAGSFANWLYFHYGVHTIELDVWGVPSALKAKATDSSPVKIGDTNAVAPTPTSTVARGAGRNSNAIASNPLGASASASAPNNDKDIMAYVDSTAPEAHTPWKAMTLADGSKVEVGGLDPFVEYAPAAKLLTPAIALHTDQVLDWAGKLAQLEILETTVSYKGDDLWLITAVGGMRGELATHTKLATRMRNKIPVRLEMKPSKGVTLITLNRTATAERLEPSTTLKGEWLVKGPKGSTVEIGLWANQAGQTRSTVTLAKEN